MCLSVKWSSASADYLISARWQVPPKRTQWNPLVPFPFSATLLAIMPRISKGLSQAYALQDFVFDALMSLKDALAGENGKPKIAREDAQSIAALTKAWESCQQRIQVHRRIPNPGSLKHAVPKARRMRKSMIQPEPVRPEPV